LEDQSRQYPVRTVEHGISRLSGQGTRNKEGHTPGADGKTSSPTKGLICGSFHGVVQEYIDRCGPGGTRKAVITSDIITEMIIKFDPPNGLIAQNGNDTTLTNVNIKCQAPGPGAT
jgi:hypothetical protein